MAQVMSLRVVSSLVRLLEVVEEATRSAGVQLLNVVTGGDLGHAPARAAYEGAGFTALPLVNFHKAL